MLIITGQRNKPRDVGQIEDFCPLCRSLQVFHVTEAIIVSHVYFVPVHKKSTGVFQKVCGGCACEFAQKSNPMDRLEDPDLHASGYPRALGASERAAIEELIEEPMPPDLRSALLREPFVALGPWVQGRIKRGFLDGIGALAVFVLLVMVILFCIALLGVVGTRFSLAKMDFWLMVGSVIIGAWAMMVISKSGKRFATKRVQPLLVRSLQPMHPSFEELQDTLSELRRKKNVLAKHIDARKLCDALMNADELALGIAPFNH